jgi:choline dehydrogenase-like flavoprotein
MPTRTDTLVIGAGSAGLFCALRWAEHGSVTVVESGPDAGDPPPHWALHDYVLPEAHYYYRYTDSATGKPVPQGRGLGGGWPDCLEGFRAIESDQQFGHSTIGPAAAKPVPWSRRHPPVPVPNSRRLSRPEARQPGMRSQRWVA